MPLYDYECPACGNEVERLTPPDSRNERCGDCGGVMNRIPNIGRINCANDDAPWIRDTAKVADPEKSSESAEFVKNPTRRNYTRWMKKHGYRHVEDGEKPIRRRSQAEEHAIIDGYADKLASQHQKRKRLEL